jgi:hypothetical protein
MYYAPRYSPDKPGMPILGYFVVVGAILTALLFTANAYMAKPTKLSFASNFDGLPAEYKGEPGTRRPAEAVPALASLTPTAETTGSAPAAEPPHAVVAQQQPEAAKAAKPQRKVVHKQRQRQNDDDWFGGNNRRDFANSRDPFSSGEPSWRDSWASGGFDQPRVSRRASRSNNDFWFR